MDSAQNRDDLFVGGKRDGAGPVSYTHLDVYKRQVFGAAFTGTHARLGRFLGDGLIREDFDPHLAAALDIKMCIRDRYVPATDARPGSPRGTWRSALPRQQCLPLR